MHRSHSSRQLQRQRSSSSSPQRQQHQQQHGWQSEQQGQEPQQQQQGQGQKLLVEQQQQPRWWQEQEPQQQGQRPQQHQQQQPQEPQRKGHKQQETSQQGEAAEALVSSRAESNGHATVHDGKQRESIGQQRGEVEEQQQEGVWLKASNKACSTDLPAAAAAAAGQALALPPLPAAALVTGSRGGGSNAAAANADSTSQRKSFGGLSSAFAAAAVTPSAGGSSSRRPPPSPFAAPRGGSGSLGVRFSVNDAAGPTPAAAGAAAISGERASSNTTSPVKETAAQEVLTEASILSTKGTKKESLVEGAGSAALYGVEDAAYDTWDAIYSQDVQGNPCRYTLPYALLKVSVRMPRGSSGPTWLKTLMNSDYVIELDDWSKFVHGCAALLPETVRAVPYWVDDPLIEQSIAEWQQRRQVHLQQQHELDQQRQQQQLEAFLSEQAQEAAATAAAGGGSFLTSAASAPAAGLPGTPAAYGKMFSSGSPRLKHSISEGSTLERKGSTGPTNGGSFLSKVMSLGRRSRSSSRTQQQQQQAPGVPGMRLNFSGGDLSGSSSVTAAGIEEQQVEGAGSFSAASPGRLTASGELLGKYFSASSSSRAEKGVEQRQGNQGRGVLSRFSRKDTTRLQEGQQEPPAAAQGGGGVGGTRVRWEDGAGTPRGLRSEIEPFIGAQTLPVGEVGPDALRGIDGETGAEDAWCFQLLRAVVPWFIWAGVEWAVAKRLRKLRRRAARKEERELRRSLPHAR